MLECAKEFTPNDGKITGVLFERVKADYDASRAAPPR